MEEIKQMGIRKSVYDMLTTLKESRIRKAGKNISYSEVIEELIEKTKVVA